MRSVMVVALLTLSSSAFCQECVRPDWGKCASFPNGGSLTGVSPQHEHVQMQVMPGADICVSDHDEIGGETFAHFSRNGTPWPETDWAVIVDDFCFSRK
jgi:hypothetical protein